MLILRLLLLRLRVRLRLPFLTLILNYCSSSSHACFVNVAAPFMLKAPQCLADSVAG